MSDFKEIDQELLNGYLQSLGRDVLAKMLELYVRQSSNYIDNIQQSIKAQSQDAWEDACHKMKGAAGSVGLIDVHAQLASLEKSTELWENKQQAFDLLLALNQDSIAKFNLWLAQ